MALSDLNSYADTAKEVAKPIVQAISAGALGAFLLSIVYNAFAKDESPSEPRARGFSASRPNELTK